MPETSCIELAKLCKATGDSLRLEILHVLARDSYGVLELSELFDVKQSGMSHHLKTLANAGLVTTRREGNSIFYRRSTVLPEEPFATLKHAVFESVLGLSLSAEQTKRLQAVHQERSKASRQFFVENADKFRKQQDLIAAYPSYGPTVAEQVRHLPGNKRSALEIGPGEGEFLDVLSTAFDEVIAIDNSEAMLTKARQLGSHQGLRNIEFVLGDTGTLRDFPKRFDCAVVNMVLHHTPSPQQIFLDLSAALKSEATLVVTELCQHNQEWVKEACGDLWMGFAPEDLDQWAQNANLNLGQSSFLALRNGFQIQIRQFLKP